MTHSPCVSVIVRTKDRPIQLKNALCSISAQDYRPLEVVVVNDGGCHLSPLDLQAVFPDISVRLIELDTNLGRARAANTGIRNCSGEYICFLDDDDKLQSHHISALIMYLDGREEKVAYSKVDFVQKKADEDCTQGRLLHTFGRSFDPRELIIANYIPFISVLFDAGILKEMMIDEGFELYEDWDLLIRLSQITDFVFVDQVTCIYYQHYENQIAFCSDQSVIQKNTEKLYEKHRDKLPVDKIFQLREMCRKQGDEVHKLQQELNDTQKALSACRSELRAVLGSRIWRVFNSCRRIWRRLLLLCRSTMQSK